MAWNRTQINELLNTNPKAVERAMVRLYDLQTKDEKVNNGSRWLNGQGFQSSAAKRGTYYARWVLGGRPLTGVHLERARAIAVRHSRQLVEIANRTK